MAEQKFSLTYSLPSPSAQSRGSAGIVTVRGVPSTLLVLDPKILHSILGLSAPTLPTADVGYIYPTFLKV